MQETKHTSACPSYQELVDFTEGRVSLRTEEVRLHLGACAQCRTTAAELSRLLGLLKGMDSIVKEPPKEAVERARALFRECRISTDVAEILIARRVPQAEAIPGVRGGSAEVVFTAEPYEVRVLPYRDSRGRGRIRGKVFRENQEGALLVRAAEYTPRKGKAPRVEITSRGGFLIRGSCREEGVLLLTLDGVTIRIPEFGPV